MILKNYQVIEIKQVKSLPLRSGSKKGELKKVSLQMLLKKNVEKMSALGPQQMLLKTL
jgi:hypothetical protein